MRMEDKIVALWKLLDDIDTLDDACRDNDQMFRNSTRGVQLRRFEIVGGEEFDALQSLRSPQVAGQDGEPVAWRYRSYYDQRWEFWPSEDWGQPYAAGFKDRHPEAQPLFAAAPPSSFVESVGVSREQIAKMIMLEVQSTDFGNYNAETGRFTCSMAQIDLLETVCNKAADRVLTALRALNAGGGE